MKIAIPLLIGTTVALIVASHVTPFITAVFTRITTLFP